MLKCLWPAGVAILLWSAAANAEDLRVPVDYRGQRIELLGRFEKPVGPGPFPVAIVLHNCAGFYNTYASAPVWAELFRRRGWATLRLDSFTARGFSEVCGHPFAVTPGERAADAFAAAALLALRPDVRPDRIATIGYSHGASAAVYLARDHDELRPLRTGLAGRHGSIVASVALYPGCGLASGNPVIVPLLILAGGRDDWTPPERCVALVGAQAPGIAGIEVYPDAYHSFDTPGRPHYYLGHMIAYDAAATEDARRRVVEFLSRYLH